MNKLLCIPSRYQLFLLTVYIMFCSYSSYCIFKFFPKEDTLKFCVDISIKSMSRKGVKRGLFGGR